MTCLGKALLSALGMRMRICWRLSSSEAVDYPLRRGGVQLLRMAVRRAWPSWSMTPETLATISSTNWQRSLLPALPIPPAVKCVAD